MEHEKLISELREIASQTPPICTKDKPEDVVMFGNTITIYCKPFEQFQELVARAADALEVDAVPVVHGRWRYYHKNNIAVCTNCSFERNLDADFGRAVSCPNCGAKMDGDGNG